MGMKARSGIGVELVNFPGCRGDHFVPLCSDMPS